MARARAGAPSDPEPVLSALALVLVTDLLGELHAIPASDRAALSEAGPRALLAGCPDGSDDDDWQLARGLARAGLDALKGRSPARPPGDPLHPAPGVMLAMLDGRPDGLSAGSTAAHVARCDRCRSELEVLSELGGPEARLAVAAASAQPMRAPMEGRVVDGLSDPEVEAVLFEDGRLALYASAPEPVRLVADGVTTEEMMSGYWLGKVPPGTEKLQARVHIGAVTVDWEITLTVG